MFQRLWTFEGSCPISSGVSEADAMRRAIDALRKQYKTPIEGAGMVSYDQFFPRGGNSLSTLAIFNSGQIWFERSSQGLCLRYRNSCFTGFIFCLAAAGLFCLFDFRESIAAGAMSFVFVFGWLYGMNMLLAAIRIPSFFRKIANG